MDFFKDTWCILDEYFKSNYFLTKHHLDSYNDFILNKLPNTIRVLNPFIVIKNQDNGTTSHEINVYIGGEKGDEIFIDKPTIIENGEQRLMYPNEARLKNMTYKSDLYANIIVKYITKKTKEKETIEENLFKNVKIGSIPIMLHSCLCVLNNQPPQVLHEMGECIYDQGGYFIIDGKEKVIVAQERIVTNRIFINNSKDPKFSYEGLIRCTSEENPLFPKTINIYVYNDKEIKKEKDDDDEDSSTLEKDEPNKETKEKKDDNGEVSEINKYPNAIIISSPNISTKIPLFVLFRAMGVESDKDILKYIIEDDPDDPDNKAMIDFLRYSIIHASTIQTQDDALKYLTNFVEYKNVDKLKHVIINDLFPNVGNEFKNKALFLGHIVKKLIKVCLGITKESDRDSYIFKRVDISGFLMGNLFRDYYNQFRQTVRNNIDSQYLYGPWKQLENIKFLINKGNLDTFFKSDIVDNGMKKSLKGSWGVNMVEEQQDLDDIKQGLVQDLSRISYMGFMSHLRRVNTPMDPTSKIVAPHRLHPSQWGIMCPCESPDGASIGLLKNMAIMCTITFDSAATNIMNCLKENSILLLTDVDIRSVKNSTKVLINSNWVGIHNEPEKLFKLLKLLKRNALISIYTSISWDIIQNEINILTEAGRCCRPVYVIHNKKLIIEKYIEKIKKGEIKWNKMITGFTLPGEVDVFNSKYISPKTVLSSKIVKGKSIKLEIEDIITMLEENQAPIEFIDVEESNTSYIAMDDTYLTKSKYYTHCEIHPSTIFGILTHQIPLCNHNQAPRNIFSGAQGKQALGAYATNFNNRIDTMSYVLHYPQKRIVNTRFCEYLNLNRMPHGENLIVAMMPWGGYNMEDAIIINESAIQRGMFNITYYKNIVDQEEENKNSNELITFNNPMTLIDSGKPLNELKWANYKKLDENGFPKINSYIGEGDAILGRTKIATEMVEDDNLQTSIFGSKVKKEMYYDRSMIADKTMSGTVDKVYVYTNEQNLKTCKLRFRKIRLPELGDKSCSAHAQKGVIGMVIPQHNMPFTKDGIVPDLIINPHGLPSRMTLGHMLETLLGKVGSCQGTTVDGTPFNNNDYSEFYLNMEKEYGFERHGNEMMYNGLTGEQIQTDIFIGPIYYERLKHMVADKINYRQVNLRTIYNEGKEVILKDAPVSAMTRQPTKGRGNNGGLRIGEMEKDSILSHGMTAFLKESLMERSDKFDYYIDNETHSILNKDLSNAFDVSKIETPYAFKQFVQEMISLGIKPILETEENDENDENYIDHEEMEL
jgi:DNA-directed RNA polymerase II subunit RPB2